MLLISVISLYKIEPTNKPNSGFQNDKFYRTSRYNFELEWIKMELKFIEARNKRFEDCCIEYSQEGYYGWD